MRIFRDTEVPFAPADVSTFVGRAATKRLAATEYPTTVHVYRVAFEAGGRTNWHRHSGAQWLFAIDGRIRAQTWGERAVDVRAGDAVLIAPGEKHWHGAPPDSPGVHLAVNISAKTEWLEPVSDADYRDAPG
jgi:quercetin dioxygenase-like cupin family protein